MAVQLGGALLYVGAAVAYLAYLTNPKVILARIATISLVLGVAGHTVCFVGRALFSGLPLTNTGVILSILAWAVAGVWLIAQYYTKAVTVGAFVAPVAAVFAILAGAVPNQPLLDGTPPALLWLHLGSVYLGTAVFALASCVGIAYLIQERQVKRKTIGALFRRLPSLDVLDRVGYRSQAFGFALLTTALITGAIIAAATGRADSFHLKWEVLGTIVLWAWYAAALQTRLFAGWRGRKGAWFAVAGFGILLVSFVGVRVVLMAGAAG